MKRIVVVCSKHPDNPSQRLFAPSEQILHRDLKPSNMLLALEGSGCVVLRLADFGSATELCTGAARLADGGRPGLSREASAGTTQELTTRMCTVPYAAPEILLGSTEPAPLSLSTGPRSDAVCSGRMRVANVEALPLNYHDAELNWPRYGPEADMWSLGCIIGELLSGAKPLFLLVAVAVVRLR